MGEGVAHEFPGGRGTWRNFLEEVQELVSLCTYGKMLGSRESLCEGSAGETSQCSQEGLGFPGLESPGWRPRSGHQGKAFLAAPGAEVGVGTVGKRGWNGGRAVQQLADAGSQAFQCSPTIYFLPQSRP